MTFVQGQLYIPVVVSDSEVEMMSVVVTPSVGSETRMAICSFQSTVLARLRYLPTLTQTYVTYTKNSKIT